MTDIEKALAEYKETKEAADVDLEEWPQASIIGATSNKKSAQQRLPGLRKAYDDLVRPRSIVIFLEGAPAACSSFAEIAAAQAGTVAVDGQGLARKIAASIEPAMGDQRMFGATLLGRYIGEIREAGKELDVLNIPPPRLFDVVQAHDHEGLVSLIQSLLRQSGPRLLHAWIERAAFDKALETGHQKGTLPVLVYGLPKEDKETVADALLSGNHFEVQAEEGAGPEGVIKALAAVREEMKKRKQQ